MPKRFKIKISSFQLCRSNKKPPFVPQKQTLASLFSPINPKAYDMYRSRIPVPPPTTPNHYSSTARIVPILVPSSHENVYINDNIESSRNKENRRTRYVLFNSPASDEGYAKTTKNIKQKATNNGWSSREDIDGLYSSMSFGSSYDFGYPLETMNENSIDTQRGDDKVKESVTVVKRSDNPYDDFKVSMLEMIMEKEMYGAKDLESLLESFLSLNSVHYHGAIVEAFAEIWSDIFCQEII